MARIGYARVSTTDQDLGLQLSALKAAACDVVRSEKASGSLTAGRVKLAMVLDFIGRGDTLVITRIDRLARSIGDFQDILRILRAKGAYLQATEQPIDTDTAAGKAFLDMLGVFTEFETNLRRERQLEGIARAKADGVYRGRPASIDASEVRALKAEGIGPAEIARCLGISRASVYRLLHEVGRVDAPTAADLRAWAVPTQGAVHRPVSSPWIEIRNANLAGTF